MSQFFVPSSGGGGGGTVTSVTGGNNITITGNPAVNPTVNVSGTTNHAVLIGNGTGSLTSITVGTTGQILTGVTGADPVFANNPAATSFITNPATGTAIPSSGVITIAGAGTTTVSAAGSTITITSTGGGGSPTAFFATRTATLNGVTGSGTDYVIPFDTVEFNDGGGFSVDTFTAPVDGRYLFNCALFMQGLLSTNSVAFIQLRTSAGTFQNDECSPYLQGFTSNGYFLNNYTNIVSLTAGQTVKFGIRVFGNVTDNVNLVGITDTGGFATSLSGHLIN